MRRFSFLCLALVSSLAHVSGCARKEVDDPAPPPSVIGATGGKAAEKKPLAAAAYDGLIKGRVVVKDGVPEMQIIEAMIKHNDKEGCLAGADFEKRDQRWIVSSDGGVANAVIFLKPPANTFFELPEKLRERSGEEVNIDQPHCAFVPHVQVSFPKYFDGKTQKLQPTGQRFVVKNSARFSHNLKYQGDSLRTGSGNVLIKSEGDYEIQSLSPEPSPITISCDIHPWMQGKIWAFDHPFAARTKEDGSFEIKNVPTGVEIALVAWHEVPGFFNGDKNGKQIKLEKGQTREEKLTVPAK